MTRFFKHSDGITTEVPEVDPAWLNAGSGVTLWADFAEPTDEEGALALVRVQVPRPGGGIGLAP